MSGSRFRRRSGKRKGLAVGLTLLAAASAAVALGLKHPPLPHLGVAQSHHAAVQHHWTPPPPPAPRDLQAALEQVAARYREPVGIAVTDLQSGWVAQVDGRAIYPQQSVSKLWTALAVLQRVDDGQLRLDQPFTMGPADRSVFHLSNDPVIGDNGYPITLTELLQRAIQNSDNAANDKLMGIAGGPDAIRAELNRKGLSGIRIGGPERELQAEIAGMVWQPAYGIADNFKLERAKVPEKTRDDALARYLADPPDGATPVGLVQGLAALKRGELLSPGSTQVFLRLMQNARTGPNRLKGGLPEGWSIAHKTGTGQDWRGGSIGINDVGLITAPDGHVYAVAVMIRRTTKPVPARLAMMQTVAKELVANWQTATGHTGPIVPAKPSTPVLPGTDD